MICALSEFTRTVKRILFVKFPTEKDENLFVVCMVMRRTTRGRLGKNRNSRENNTELRDRAKKGGLRGF